MFVATMGSDEVFFSSSFSCLYSEFPGLFHTMISSEILLFQGYLKYHIEGMEGSFRAGIWLISY